MATIQLPVLLPDLEISSIQTTNKGYILVTSQAIKQASCPGCKSHSAKINSYCIRHPAELPLFAVHVRFQLRIRRFRCINSNCFKQTFSEP
jgi:transposase